KRAGARPPTRSRTGACCPASPARATARRSRGWFTTRYADVPPAPTSWATSGRAGPSSGCCGSAATARALRAPRGPSAGAVGRVRGDLRVVVPWIAGDYPQWLDPHLARVFGDERIAEGAALASRAPLDLRVNGLKAEPEPAADALAHLNPLPTRWSPVGLRIALDADAKSPAFHAEPAFIKCMVEVQDEGSQLSALLAGARPGQQVVDLCAGAGGKTLALAAAMENRGQLYATDSDKRRLAPIHERLERAGVHNVQVRTPRGREN